MGPGQRLWGPVSCLALMSCQSLIEFPATASEDNVEACKDAVDNDLDGQSDCSDRDCDGSCFELCTDGRDNDLDGLSDGLDPECWSPSLLRRCASQGGSVVRFDARHAPDRLERAPSPDDPQRSVVRLSGSGTEVLQRSWRGDLKRLRGGMAVWMNPEVQRLSLRFDSEVGVGSAPGRFEATLAEESDEGSLKIRLPRGELEPVLLGSTGWTRLELQIELEVDGARDQAQVRLRLPERGASVAVELGLLSWPSAIPLEVELDYESSDDHILIESLELARPRYDPCGVAMPPDLLLERPRVLAAAHNGQYDCLLLDGVRTAQPLAYRVELRNKAPDQWTEQGSMAPPGRRIANPVIAWDPVAESFVGAAAELDADGHERELVSLDSQDCRNWSVQPLDRTSEADSLLQLGGEPGRLLEYAVNGSMHELWLVTDAASNARRYAKWIEDSSAADGEAGFRTVRFLSSASRDRAFEAPWISLLEIGNTVVTVAPTSVLGTLGVSLVAFETLAEGTNQRIAGALNAGEDWAIEPSGIEGSFDALGLDQGRFVEVEGTDDAKLMEFRLYYSARACTECRVRVGAMLFSAEESVEIRERR